MFCSVLAKLLDAQLPFSVSILGSHTNDIPGTYMCVFVPTYIRSSYLVPVINIVDCLQEMISRLGSKLLHKGRLPQHQYEEVLNTAHVVVSTANHEFFGVSM